MHAPGAGPAAGGDHLRRPRRAAWTQRRYGTAASLKGPWCRARGCFDPVEVPRRARPARLRRRVRSVHPIEHDAGTPAPTPGGGWPGRRGAPGVGPLSLRRRARLGADRERGARLQRRGVAAAGRRAGARRPLDCRRPTAEHVSLSAAPSRALRARECGASAIRRCAARSRSTSGRSGAPWSRCIRSPSESPDDTPRPRLAPGPRNLPVLITAVRVPRHLLHTRLYADRILRDGRVLEPAHFGLELTRRLGQVDRTRSRPAAPAG